MSTIIGRQSKGGQRWRLAQRLFGIVAFVAIAVFLGRNRHTLAELVTLRSVSALLSAAVIYVGLHLVMASSYNRIHRALGMSRPLARTMREYFLRLPNRYIPGGIWHALSRYMDMRDDSGAMAKNLFSVFIVENCLVGSSGLLVSTFAMIVLPSIGDWRITMLMLGGSVALAAFPFVWAHWRKETLAWREVLLAFVLLVIQWISVGYCFAVYASALGGEGLVDGLSVGASYVISAVSGFIVPVSPQGWGITELVFAFLQHGNLSMVLAVAALAGFRVLGLLVDLFSAMVFLGYDRLKSRNN